MYVYVYINIYSCWLQGWRALYRGNGANVVRSAPQKALDFFAFDAFKACLSGSQKGAKGGAPRQPSAVHTFMAAGMAGALSNAVLYPLEVIRCRLTTDTTGLYRGISHTAVTIVNREGFFALYRYVLFRTSYSDYSVCYSIEIGRNSNRQMNVSHSNWQLCVLQRKESNRTAPKRG